MSPWAALPDRGKRETAHAYLEAQFGAAPTLDGVTIKRVTYDVDLDRHIAAVDWPTPTKPLLVIIEGDGELEQKEKMGTRWEHAAEVEVRFWVYDRTDASRPATLNALLYDVFEALKVANKIDPAGDPFGELGFRFSWGAYRRLGGREGLPPYAGASLRVGTFFFE